MKNKTNFEKMSTSDNVIVLRSKIEELEDTLY